MIEQKEVISCDIGTHVVIKTNGDIYPCTILSQQDERFKLGNLNTNVDTEIINDLRYKTRCQKDCAFKSLCDGGCRYERIINFPNDWKCEVCSHSCDIYESLYNAANEFLESLDEDENSTLMKILNSYNIFKVSYDNGMEINRNERML